MHHKKEFSYSAQNLFLSALTHFISINDVMINRKKIKKFRVNQKINMNIDHTPLKKYLVF
jgi:hypothetical protein